MELKRYLQIMMKRWWIIMAAFICTLIPTLIIVDRQPWIFESTTTAVMRPYSGSLADEEETVKVVDTLSRRVEINTTYAEVAGSTLIKNRAIERLGLTSEERKGLKVKSKVIAGTNVLEISVQGLDPGIVSDFAYAVSQETFIYVNNLYGVFELEILDTPSSSKKPISPNKTLNLGVGGILGLFLGIGLVFLLEYLKEPLVEETNFTILDFETGVYNKRYFMLRLRQEMSRTKRNKYFLSLAIIKTWSRGSEDDSTYKMPNSKRLRSVSDSLGLYVRDEDVVAHFGRSIFALLLPDLSGEQAKSYMEGLLRRLVTDEIGANERISLSSAVGITTYQNSDLTEDELLAQAMQALTEADQSAFGNVNLFIHTAVPPQKQTNHELFSAKQTTIRTNK